ncbi:MAG: right-handed parallel beta-helix repeat-containing protein [Planctomycetota bacterium]
MIGIPHQAKEWHVSPDGSDRAAGTAADPFATLFRARDAVRAFRKANPEADEPHTVVLQAGRYRIDQTLTLGAEDSGRADSPITYRAGDDAEVILYGGTPIPSERFRRPTAEERSLLHEDARSDVRVADLTGHPAAQAFGTGQGRYGLLTSGPYTLQLARWPNRGFVHLDRVVDMGPTLRWLEQGEVPKPYSYDKPTGGRFTVRETIRLDAWQRELARTRDVLQGGYLSNDWTEDKNQVARIADDGVVQLLDATRYGIGGIRYRGGFADDSAEPRLKKNRRLYFINLLCELDMPGEWYFDRQTNRLYLWPIGKEGPTNALAIPGGPTLIKLNNASHIRFQDILFENGGSTGVEVSGGEHIALAGCTFRNFLGKAIQIEGGKHHRIDACTVYNVKTGMTIRGGDLKRLERCHHLVVNSEFRHFRGRGYGGIGLYGCGIEFRNNLYHSMNTAIKYEGAYIRFINNEFFNVGWEMGDWNVLYQGANKWCNGNIVENNFFHHMMEEPQRFPIIAVRNDDGGTGTTYQSNLFYKTGRGAISFGGPNSHILDNIVLDSSVLWWTARLPTSEQDIQREFDQIAQQFESGRYPRGAKEDAIYNVEEVVGKKGWNKPPWSTAFPNFPKYMNGNPFAQSYGSMLDNYHNLADPRDPFSVVHIHKHWALPQEDANEHETSMADMPETFTYNAPMPIDIEEAFVDPSRLDFRFKPGFKLSEGFKAFDLAQVGLFKSAHRPDPPDPSVYRSAIYQRHRGTKSWGGKYDPDTAYLRYPLQPWME